MKRKSGYYWCIWMSKYGWQIFYYSNEWIVDGEYYNDYWFEKINEERIKTPDEE